MSGVRAVAAGGALAGLLALAACEPSPPLDRAARARAAFEPGIHQIEVFFSRKDTCEVQGFPRVVSGDTPLAVTRAALDSLLAGPRAQERDAGWTSAIPDSAEAARHRRSHLAFDLDPGHDGVAPALRELRELEEGVLLVDFTAPMRAYDHGHRSTMPARLCSIVRQVQGTALQFPWWNGVRLAIEGESKGILQP